LKVLEGELHALIDGQKAFENRFAAIESEIRGRFEGALSELRAIKDKIDALESRLDVAEDIAQMKVEIAQLKARA